MSNSYNTTGAFQAGSSALLKSKLHNPHVQLAQQGAQQAVEFQLWVAQQSTALSKLKVFAAMAKSINDQQ